MEFKEIYFEQITSTNEYLKNHHFECDDFSFVRASYQTSGRGRKERHWVSNKDESLLFSLLIRDLSLVKEYASISLLAATCVYQTISKYVDNVYIKWPNDVYVNDKKICGILLEGSIPHYLVVGIGVNLLQKDFTGEYRTKPTSLLLETSKSFTFDEIKNDIYKNLIDELNKLKNHQSDYLEVVRKHLYSLNAHVSINNGDQVEQGIIKGIDDNNCLILDNNGEEKHIYSGEINFESQK